MAAFNPLDIFGKIIGGAVGANPIASVVAGVVSGVTTSMIEADSSPVPTAVVAPAAIQKALVDNKAAIVPVKSAWLSKINWAAGTALVFAFSDFINHPVPTDLRDGLSTAASVLAPLAVILFRTFFPASAVK